MAKPAASQLTMLENYQKLYVSGELADFTIKAKNGKTFNDSKFLFASQSPYFRSALHGSFKESITKEIDLSEWETESVRAMIQVVYTSYFCLSDRYNSSNRCKSESCVDRCVDHCPLVETGGDDDESTPTERATKRHSMSEPHKTSINRCFMLAKIYALGCYLQLAAVQTAAKMQFEACMRLEPCEGFKAAPVVYNEIAEDFAGLKAAFVSIVNDRIGQILHDDTNKGILQSVPELSYDMHLDRLNDRPKPVITRYHPVTGAKKKRSEPSERAPQRVACKKCWGIVHKPKNIILKCPECWTDL